MSGISPLEANKEMYETLFYHFFHQNTSRRNTLVQLCLRVLSNSDEKWRSELSGHFSHLTPTEVSPEIYFRIKLVCVKYKLLSDAISSELFECLAPYQTYNLIPCRIQKESDIGSLITVKINPDFDLRDADPRFREYFKSMEKYKIDMVQYQKNVEEHNNKKMNASSNETTSTNYDLKSRIVWLRELPTFYREPRMPSGPHLIDWNNFNIQNSFPSYSNNPESHADPQGDINWMIDYLPEKTRQFFGFSRDDNYFTFPDVMRINKKIELLNQQALKKGFGDNFIPFSLAEVDGQITPQVYLDLIVEGKLPVARPKFLTSWFYHDLLYHVLGLFLTPRNLLLKILKVSRYAVSEKISGLALQNLVGLIDNSTSWARRIVGIEYDETHESVNFYGYSISNPMSDRLTHTRILRFCILHLFGGSSKKFIQALGQRDFFTKYHNFIDELDAEIQIELLSKSIEKYTRTLEGIIDSMVSN